MDDIVLAKTHAWAAAKVGCDPSDVVDVEFASIQGGYCETCEYTTGGYSIIYNKNGLRQRYEVEAASDSIVDIIREITAMEV